MFKKTALLALAALTLSVPAWANDPKATIAQLEERLAKIGPAKVDGTDKAGDKQVPALFFGPRKINGNYDVVEYAKQMGLAAYFCQCVAWSGGELNPWRHIFQDVGPDVAGIHVDHLTIYGDEYGQWKGDTVSQKDFDDLVLACFSGSEDRDANGKTLSKEERLPIAYDRMRNRADGGFGSIADRAESAYVIAQQGGAGGGIAPHTHVPGGVQ